jgi:hypothetical protein
MAWACLRQVSNQVTRSGDSRPSTVDRGPTFSFGCPARFDKSTVRVIITMSRPIKPGSLEFV